MIGQKGPCVTAGLGFRHKSTQSIGKINLIGFILKYLFAFYPPDDDVVQHTGSVYAS
jgi:hypothetical protein